MLLWAELPVVKQWACNTCLWPTNGLYSVMTGVVKFVLSNNSNLEGTLGCFFKNCLRWEGMVIWIYCFSNNSKTPSKQTKKPLSDCMTHSLLDVLQSSLQIFPQNNWYWQRSVLQLQLWWAWYLSAMKLVDRYSEEGSQQSWIWMFSSSRNLRHNFLSCLVPARLRAFSLGPWG